MTARLIKIDRNGSKHFEGITTCPKCGGLGLIVHHMENGKPSIQWTDGGICWKCSGAGKVLGTWIERTPEYQAKLDARRQAKEEAKKAEHEAKLAEIRKEWLTNNGFTAEGQTFIFLGDTFSKKEEIKEAGGRYNPSLGWHIDHQVEGFDFITANISEIGSETYWGYSITADKREWDSKKKEALKDLNKLPESKHIGQVGQKITIKVKYIHTASWHNNFGYGYWTDNVTFLHKFADTDGNVLVWKTSKSIEEDYGTEMVLTGTVKEHSEYKGDKQTVMTRCKVTEA